MLRVPVFIMPVLNQPVLCRRVETTTVLRVGYDRLAMPVKLPALKKRTAGSAITDSGVETTR